MTSPVAAETRLSTTKHRPAALDHRFAADNAKQAMEIVVERLPEYSAPYEVPETPRWGVKRDRPPLFDPARATGRVGRVKLLLRSRYRMSKMLPAMGSDDAREDVRDPIQVHSETASQHRQTPKTMVARIVREGTHCLPASAPTPTER